MDPESPQSVHKDDPHFVYLFQPARQQSSEHLGRYHSVVSPARETDCHSLVRGGYHFLESNLKNEQQ